MMDEAKKQRLKNDGWEVGNAADFLELTPEEAEFVALRLSLSRAIRDLRTARGLSQTDLARRIGSSQSRVAKMEAAAPSVSVDLMIRCLLRIGAHRDEVARWVARPA